MSVEHSTVETVSREDFSKLLGALVDLRAAVVGLTPACDLSRPTTIRARARLDSVGGVIRDLGKIYGLPPEGNFPSASPEDS